jgi:preprotein translocase subunit SecA
LPELENVLRDEWHLQVPLQSSVEASQEFSAEDVVQRVVQEGNTVFAAKVAQVGAEQFTPFERMILLQSIDQHWREHLAALDYLRQGIHLRGYAQKNPKQEYKREAFELFSQLLDVIKMDVTRTLMTVKIQSQEQIERAASAIEAQADAITNLTYTHPNEDGSVVQEVDPSTLLSAPAPVGRNEPCPCGSGKKYKLCHGKLV